MRRYDDAVEVRRGRVPGADLEGPEQFLWHGRLWKVRAVVAHWVETGAWWSRPASADGEAGSAGAAGSAGSAGSGGGPVALGDLLSERELWRVEAGRGRPGLLDDDTEITGVFDLSFDWSDGRWQLVGCVD